MVVSIAPQHPELTELFTVDDDEDTDVTVVDGAPEPPRSHLLGGVRLSDIPTETTTWLSRGRLAAGKVHFFDGDPGVGKSTVLSDWSASITTGRALPDGDARSPANVIMLCEDGLEDTVKPRLLAAGGDPERVVVLAEKPYGGGCILPQDVRLIEQFVVEERAALLIIDPWIAFLDPKLNPHSDHDVRQALSPLVEMAKRTGIAVVLVRHFNKSSDRPALYGSNGSIGITGAARVVLMLGKHPQNPDQLVLARIKGNLGAQPPSLLYELEPVPNLGVARVVCRGEINLSADELVSAEVPGKRNKLA
jgi:hypothetical protein